MGAAHSLAWRSAHRFFELPYTPSMAVVVGRNPDSTAEAARTFGWSRSSTDISEAINSDDVQLVDICAPGFAHAEIAIEALEAGKHVLCEKPLANTVAEAERMSLAASRAAERGVFAMVGFSYRRVPALALARQMIVEGRIGEVRQVRAVYLQDWLADENGPMTWRLDKSLAGSGSLGDIGAHALDAVQFLTGLSIESVSGTLETLVTERPLLAESIGLGGTASKERGAVTVDDVALFHARLSSGALASFEASRFATGRKNAFRIEVSGSSGALAFDLERMNELDFFDRRDSPESQGFRRILVTEPVHPYLAAWWPPGHTIGWEHSFTHQVRDLLVDISEGRQPSPSFADGLSVQRVLAAVEQSAANGSVWTDVDSHDHPDDEPR
jgi:predicted dehydrogenase